MAGTHDLLVVDGDVLEQREEIDLLLVVGAEQVVVRLPGEREHWRSVELRVVETVEKVNRARPRRRETNANSPGELGVAARHEGRGFLVTHLDVANAVLPLAQRLHDAVDAVAGEPEHDGDSPVEEAVHEDV
jgi:hypothetical protein